MTEDLAAHDPALGAAPGGGDAPSPRRRVDWRLVPPLVLILLVLGVAGVLIANTGKSSPALPNHVHQVKTSAFVGAVASPAVPAPPLALRNYQGASVNLAGYRGKAVLVTFLYANCPTLCPLIAANLHSADRMLGAEASKVALITVSVDPRGDTPHAVASFLRAHGLTGRMQYLVGNAHQLGRVWSAWNVGSQADASQPDLINHSGLVFGIGASGRLTTLYPGNFKPSDIVHDVPGLLAS